MVPSTPYHDSATIAPPQHLTGHNIYIINILIKIILKINTKTSRVGKVKK